MSENEVAVNSDVPAPKVQSPAEEEQRKLEKLAASRLFFVRLPKPAEFASTDGLEKEKDALDAKTRDISAELKPIMAERSRVSAQLAESREVIREVKAQIEDRQLTLDPYQAEKKAAAQDRATERLTREEQWQAEQKQRDDEHRALLNSKQKIKNDFSTNFGHLGVANEDEIDAKIRKLEFQQQHESLSINEEKAVLKNIKQLQDSREAVREYAQWTAQESADREARKAQQKKRAEEKARASKEKDEQPDKAEGKAGGAVEDPQQQEMRQLKSEVDGLWEELRGHLKVKAALQEEEGSFRKQIDGLIEQRDSLRKEREEVWDKIQAHRSKVRAANKPFGDNRGFSSSVRELVKKGQVEEARQQCRDQTNEFMARYASDASARDDYNRLWDAAVDFKRPMATASESHTNAAASVIAEALEAARKSVASKAGRSKEAEVTKSIDTARPKPKEEVASEPDATTAPAAKPLPVSRPDIPGMENGGRPKPRPKKDKKVKPVAVELPKLDETAFVPPASVLKSSGPSAAELKEQEIAHNKAAAAEAAQRKERRKAAQEKKKVQKAQRAELQAKAPRQEVVEEPSHPETPPAEDTVANGGLSDGEAPSAAAALEDKVSKAKKKAASINAGAARAAAAAFNVPKAKRVKKGGQGWSATLRQYSKGAQAAFEEYPLYVSVGGAAAVAVGVILPVLLYALK